MQEEIRDMLLEIGRGKLFSVGSLSLLVEKYQRERIKTKEGLKLPDGMLVLFIKAISLEREFQAVCGSLLRVMDLQEQLDQVKEYCDNWYLSVDDNNLAELKNKLNLRKTDMENSMQNIWGSLATLSKEL